MRKWFVPLTVLGLGGIGALALSERGRRTIEWLFEKLDQAPDRIAELSDSAQAELEKIELALNDIAETLKTRPAN